MEKTYYTTDQVAARLQVSGRTIRRMCDAGEMPHVKVGRQYRIPVKMFEIWLEAHTFEVQPA